jgi:hypothetical protein
MSARRVRGRCLRRTVAGPSPATPADLRAAPELALLDLLDHGLAALLLALRAQHPSLDHPTGPAEPPTLGRARRVARALGALAAELADYRDAVIDVTRPASPGDDDFPF